MSSVVHINDTKEQKFGQGCIINHILCISYFRDVFFGISINSSEKIILANSIFIQFR